MKNHPRSVSFVNPAEVIVQQGTFHNINGKNSFQTNLNLLYGGYRKVGISALKLNINGNSKGEVWDQKYKLSYI